MPIFQFAASDMKKMLAVHGDLCECRLKFGAALHLFLAELCMLVDATCIAAYHVRSLSPLHQTALPLLELRQNRRGRRPNRTSLVGTSVIDGYRFKSEIVPVVNVVTAFGVPAWAKRQVNWNSLRNRKHVICSTQYTTGLSEPIATTLILTRSIYRRSFSPRELAIVDTMWASHHVAFKQPAPRRLAMAKLA